jgi:transposase InsO family protein
VLGQHRSTQRKAPRGREDEGRLVADIIELARQYGRYGYRKIAALLRQAGWLVNDKRVERIWRCEGLKVPTKQPKRGRLWLNDGSCVRLRAEHPNHVWSYDFVEDRTHEEKKYRMLNVVDEFTRECLSIRVNRRLNSTDVIDVLSDLFILRGVPEHIRSDNGPEFVAKAVQKWIHAVGAKTAYIAPGSPWENGYVLAEPSFAWTRALTPDCVTSSSTESFSTRLQRLGSSSRAGGGTITVSDLTHHSDTNHRRQKCSYPATPRGRLRSLKRLQRPHSP